MYTEGAAVAALTHQKLMALPKEAARLASLKASDTVWGKRRQHLNCIAESVHLFVCVVTLPQNGEHSKAAS